MAKREATEEPETEKTFTDGVNLALEAVESYSAEHRGWSSVCTALAQRIRDAAASAE